MIEFISTYGLWIGLAIFPVYVIILTLKGGVEKDITHLIYRLNEKWQWITTAVYWISAGMIGFNAVLNNHWILLLCAVAFATVGLFPDVRVQEKWKVKVHVIAAISAVMLGVVSSFVELHSWFYGLAFVIFMLGIKYKKITINHTTYWVEAAAYLVILLSVLRNEKMDKK